MERFDIAIIGTGPAGLSAAVTAKIRNKRILVLGPKALSGKVAKAHEIQNYLGLPNCGGAELAAAFQRHMDAMEIAITEDKVTAVYAMGAYFALQTASNTIYEAQSVILATGMIAAKPFRGETEFLGRGVSYCATCDAPLYKGKTVAVIGGSAEEEAEADFMAEVAGTVYYLPLYKEEPRLKPTVKVLHEVPEEITGAMKATGLKTDKATYEVDGVFILRESVAPAQLVPGLKTDGNHVVTDRKMATSIAGCFACGDLTGTPYQYIKAAGEGNVAALSAVAYLDEKRRNAEQKEGEKA